MATKAGGPQLNGVPKKPTTPRAPAKKPAAARQMHSQAKPIQNKAASVAGGEGAPTSAYAIMANRIANRVAEMAESITFVER